MTRLLLALLTLSLLGCGRPDRPAPEPKNAAEEETLVTEGQLQEAPDFELATLEGDIYRLSERRGKVVLVNFWATWCGPCVRETPALVALQNEWSDEPFEIVGVSLDQEGFEVIEPFAERYEVSYPLVVDDGSVADSFGGVYAMPSSFIVDKEGRIAHRVIGEIHVDDLRDRLKELMDA